MVVSMSQRPWYTHKAPKIIEIISFKGSREVLQGGYTYIYIFLYCTVLYCTVVMN